MSDWFQRNGFVSKDELSAPPARRRSCPVQTRTPRKLLGEGNGAKFIATVPGKGYAFVAPLDPPDDGDIIIEQRTIERVTVEDVRACHNCPRQGVDRVGPAAAAVIVLAALGGWLIWRLAVRCRISIRSR